MKKLYNLVELNWANDLLKRLTNLKELYVSNSEEADTNAQSWSSLLFGQNINGDDFWSIGKDYISNIIMLLGHTKKYDKLDVKKKKKLFKDESEINKLLNNDASKDFNKLRDILMLNDAVKKAIFDYIDNKLFKLLSYVQSNDDIKQANIQQIEYRNLNEEAFDYNGTFYVGENIKYHNLKAIKIEIMDELESGLVTLNEIDKKYLNDNFINLCSELIIKDCSDWDDRITTSDEVVKFLSDEVYITVHSKMIEIWFNTSDNDLFGGHNPVLELHVDKDFKCVSME